MKAEKKVIFWSYSGYIGDEFWGGEVGIEGGKKLADVVPGRQRQLLYKDWLNQRGFGPGYYNSSGAYVVVYKTTVPADFDLSTLKLPGTHSRLIDGEEAAKQRVKELRAHAREMNKRNPY